MAGITISSDDTRYALASLVGFFWGTSVRGLQDLELSEEVSGELIYGNGQESLGLPPGAIKGSGKFTTIPEEGIALISTIGNGWSQVPGSLSLTLAEVNNPLIYSVAANSVFIRKLALNFGKAGGSDPSLKSFEFVVAKAIDWGGYKAINAPAGVSQGLQLAVNLFG